jgi:hypothetical protein
VDFKQRQITRNLEPPDALSFSLGSFDGKRREVRETETN